MRLSNTDGKYLVKFKYRYKKRKNMIINYTEIAEKET